MRRFRLGLLLGVLGSLLLTGCAAVRRTVAPPTGGYAMPVYGNASGGDPGIGRDGTGAFAR